MITHQLSIVLMIVYGLSDHPDKLINLMDLSRCSPQ